MKNAWAQRGSCCIQNELLQDFQGQRHKAEGEEQLPHSEELISDFAELSVTTIKIRGLKAAEQVRTGQNMCLCVPALSSPLGPLLWHDSAQTYSG